MALAARGVFRMPREAGEELGIVHGADFFDGFQLFSVFFLMFL